MEPEKHEDEDLSSWEVFAKKYVKTKSVTWWMAFLPLLMGVLMGLGMIVPGLQWIPAAVLVYYPGATPFTLINIGLFGIGLRGVHK